jgi:hypothetical protein
MTEMAKQLYLGSVGITSPRLFDILNENWEGPHPNLSDKKYPLRNYSSLTAYKLFHMHHDISLKESDVSFLSETHARLLAVRDLEGTSKDKRDEINQIIENSKTAGQEIVISSSHGGKENSWTIPANDQTIGFLTKAFDIAVATKSHIAVTILPLSHDATIMTMRGKAPSKSSFKIGA